MCTTEWKAQLRRKEQKLICTITVVPRSSKQRKHVSEQKNEKAETFRRQRDACAGEGKNGMGGRRARKSAQRAIKNKALTSSI
jgi:hypothetical protein